MDERAPYATDTLLSLVNADNAVPSPRELDLLMSCGEIISGVILTTTLQKAGYKSICLNGAQAGIITDNTFGDARIVKVDTRKIVDLLKTGLYNCGSWLSGHYFGWRSDYLRTRR